MTACIVPHCGREVGSKGTPHEPDSCGRPSCELFSRGAAWQREQDGGDFVERLRALAAELAEVERKYTQLLKDTEGT